MNKWKIRAGNSMKKYTIVNITNNVIRNNIKKRNIIILYFSDFINIVKFIITSLIINSFYYYNLLIILNFTKHKILQKKRYRYFYVSVSCPFMEGYA